MKAFSAFFLLLLMSLTSGASAQTVRYATSDFSLGADSQTDTIIFEQRAGANITGATIDFCYATTVGEASGSIAIRNWDRIVVNLKANEEKLEGVGLSQERKNNVSISLNRKANGDQISYSGAIELDGKRHIVSTRTPLWADSVNIPFGIFKILEKPKEFGEVLPNVLVVKFKRGTLAELIKSLKGMNVSLDVPHAYTNICEQIRSGFQNIYITTPPEQAVALAAKLRKFDMVAAAGWGDGSVGYFGEAIRLPGAGRFENGKLNRTKLQAELGPVLAKYTKSTLLGSKWDATTGELVFQMKRLSQLFKDSGLTEQFAIRVLASPGSPNNSDHVLFYFGEVAADLIDDQPGPILRINKLALYAGPVDGIPIQIETEVLAKELKGQTWDRTKSRWISH